MLEIFYNILPYLITALTATIAWNREKIGIKLGWKKEEKETETIEIDNVGKNLGLYQAMIDDIDKRYNVRLSGLEEEFNESTAKLRSELQSLQMLFQKVKKINKEQTTIIEKLELELQHYKDNCKEITEH